MIRLAIWPTLCLSLALALAAVAPAATPARSPRPVPTSRPLPAPPAPGAAACRVTQPNGDVPPGLGNPDYASGYGNDALWTNLWMWGDAPRVPAPASHVLPDGSLGPVKWAWYRYRPGRLAVEGRRLDAPAPPLRVEISDGYGTSGFHPVSLIFPTAGCWEITGRVGDASLTFVTLVIPPDRLPG